MPLQTLVARTLPIPSPLRHSRRPSAASPLLRRRAPIVGALWILSVGALAALAYRTGCAQSHRKIPLFRSKFANQSPARALHSSSSSAMEAASATVPSIVVYVTVPNKEAGIESVYWWDGKVQTDSEELLIIKTRESLLDALTEHVKSKHEYEVPEVISLPITGGNVKYLEWIKNSTREI